MANTLYEHPVTVRDVYNARHRLRIDALAGQNPIQTLCHQFTREDFFWGSLLCPASLLLGPAEILLGPATYLLGPASFFLGPPNTGYFHK